MNSMNSSTKLLAAFLCGAALVGCKAVETIDPTPVYPNPASTVVINGDVSGLGTARPVVLRIVTTTPTNTGTSTPGGVTTNRTLSVRGTNVLRFGAVAVGSTYAITIDAQPYGRDCTIANGSGTATADVQNVAVTCVPTNIPRFTLSVNIAAALAAAPPAGFAIKLVTEEGTETISPTTGQLLVTFALPIFYPGANPPTFNYTVTATNSAGGTVNNCRVDLGTGALGSGTGNISASGVAPTVASCLYTVSAAATYSLTPACNNTTTTPATVFPNTGCTPAIAAQLAPGPAMGAGGLQLGLRNQITGAVLPGPLLNAFSATAVAFPGTYPSNTSALYEVIVQSNPSGQTCIVLGGGMANLVSSLANVTVQIRCRDVPVLANQLKGVYQLDPPAIQEVIGSTTAIPAGATLPQPRIQRRAFMTFFPNGTFINGTHPNVANAGVEYGFYNYLPATGNLQFTILTDTSLNNASVLANFDVGLSGRTGASGGAVTATNVVKTAGAVGLPGRLSMQFGAFVAPVPAVAAVAAVPTGCTPNVNCTTNPVTAVPAVTGNGNNVWSMTEPRQTLGQIQGAWTTADNKRVFVYDDVTYYGFHVGVNGAPNLQDACFTIVDPRQVSSYYTRRGGDTLCMSANTGQAITTNGTVSMGTVDVPNATTTNSTQPLIPGFLGRLPGSISNAFLSPSPVTYVVTPGAPDALHLQNNLNTVPIDLPVDFIRATTY